MQHPHTFTSLPNVSDKIRWSFDFRWQRPDEPVGRPMTGVMMRSLESLQQDIDWEGFMALKRHASYAKSLIVSLGIVFPRKFIFMKTNERQFMLCVYYI